MSFGGEQKLSPVGPLMPPNLSDISKERSATLAGQRALASPNSTTSMRSKKKKVMFQFSTFTTTYKMAYAYIMNDELPKKNPAIKWYLLCSLIIRFTVSSQPLKPWEKNYQNHWKYDRSLHDSGNFFLPKSITTRAKEMLVSPGCYTSWDLTGILLHSQYFFVNQFFVVLTVSFPVKHLHYSECVFCVCVCLSPSCKDAGFFFFPCGLVCKYCHPTYPATQELMSQEFVLYPCVLCFCHSGQLNPSHWAAGVVFLSAYFIGIIMSYASTTNTETVLFCFPFG